MPRPRSPRRGSRSFSPRRRTDHIDGRIRYWPTPVEGPQLLGFAGYKAGMTHLFVIEDSEKKPEFGQEIKVAATVIDTPPMQMCAIRGYEMTYEGLKVLSETWMAEPDKNLLKKLKNTRKPDPAKALEHLTSLLGKIKEIRILAATQPRLTSMPKNVPDLIEIKIGGGSIENQLDYAKNLLGKTISVSDIFKPGEFVDIAGATKGKGFQGPVKRWGIRILQNKSRKTIRGVAAINPAAPRTINPNVPRAGQMGLHHRVEINKRVVLIGSDGNKVTPTGGFNRYGLVKGDYLVIKGSVMGPAKRLVRFRKAIKPMKLPETAPNVTFIKTEWKKEVKQ
ncbi:50S ribosomal protein L3 [Candidatus Bathyarchaeota archaeon]|nr:50S ribosomal protein L3 [Candidatus Bathyarchaeota archaeon]